MRPAVREMAPTYIKRQPKGCNHFEIGQVSHTLKYLWGSGPKKGSDFEQKMSYYAQYLAVRDRNFTDRKLSKNDGGR